MMGRVLGALVVCVVSAGVAAGQRIDERPAGPGEWGFRPADAAVVSRNPPSFSWRPQPGSPRYEFQASRDPSFGEVDYEARELRWNVHCPDRAFEAGNWSWRFRVAGKSTSAWSRVRSLRVADDAKVFLVPPRDVLLARIPTDHPRLFVRPEDRSRLKELAGATQRVQFENLLRQCDALIRKPPSVEEPPLYPAGTVRGSDPWRALWWGNRGRTIQALEGAANLAFAWWITERDDYADAARRLLMAAAAWDPKGSTGYRYNDEAGMPYAYYFSRAYTFLSPRLSSEDRVLCRAVMRERGHEMFAHLSKDHLWRPYSSHSNRAWHFLGEVGIAFHGEIPEAGDWVDFAVQVFANVYPVWSDSEGGWHEGLAYWRSYLERFTWWADIQKSALGLDAYQLPFFSKTGDFALYLMPPGTRGGGFGDQNARQESTANRRFMTVLATQANNPYWRWYVDQLGGPDHGAGFVGFLRAAARAAPAKSPVDLPSSRVFRGTGQAFLNTELTDASKNVSVIFKSSPFGTQSHGYESQNAFLLYAYGERLLIRSGKRDQYGSDHHRRWMWQTKSVNSLTIGGKGQIVHSPEALGEITDFQTEEGFHTVEGEAAAAYGGRLESFRRRIIVMDPDLVVVIDRVQSKVATPMEWHLHAPTPFEASGDGTFLVRNGAAGCRVRFLAPRSLEFSQTDRFDPPPRERIKLVEHHLTATLGATTSARIVTVVRPFRRGEEPPAEATFLRGEGRWELAAPLGGGRATLRVGDDGTVLVRRHDAGGDVTLERELRADAVDGR